MYVDMDTMFLRDYRPLYDIPLFSYREGSSIVLNIAVLRLGQRPHELTRNLIAQAALDHQSTQRTLSTIMKPWYNASPWSRSFTYLSQSLFDFVWMRFLAYQEKSKGPVHQEMMQTSELAAIHSEFTIARHWNAFFDAVGVEDTRARQNATFLSGSYSYHWHNRYKEGLRPDTWAGIMHERFTKLAMLKAPVCAPAAVVRR